MWRSLLKTHDEVVFIPMSSGLSNTCQTAAVLARDEEFAGRVHVVDNHRISVTQAQSVYDARILAKTCNSGSKIKEILEKESLDATIYIAVDTLEYLKKRRPHHAGSRSRRHRPQPEAGPYHPGGTNWTPVRKTRGIKTAFKTMCKALEKDIRTRFGGTYEHRQLKIGMATTFSDEEKLSYFRDELTSYFPDLELFAAPLTMSIGCHVGPGALGIGAFLAH